MVRMGWSQLDYEEADESLVDALLEFLVREGRSHA